MDVLKMWIDIPIKGVEQTFHRLEIFSGSLKLGKRNTSRKLSTRIFFTRAFFKIYDFRLSSVFFAEVFPVFQTART